MCFTHALRRAVLEKRAVMPRAFGLFGIVFDRTCECRRMRTRKDEERLNAFGMAGCDEPCDLAAPIVSDEMEAALRDVAVGNTNIGPSPILRCVFSPGQGSTAKSNNCMSPNSERVPPRALGTVTNAKVGRISWTKGKSENRGSRGMIGLTMTWLVWT